MSKFITKPNLPDRAVETVLIGNHPEIIALLNEMAIKTVVLQDNCYIDYSVRNHADMAACYMGGGKLMLDKNQSKASGISAKMGMTVFNTEKPIKGEYPNDVVLNCAIFGGNLVCFPKGTAAKILEENADKRLFSVKQGYCKCSICPVTENAIITDDVGIYNKTKEILDVLLIDKGDIFLEDKNYGFIGGASAKINEDTMLFFGNVDTHRNAGDIKTFLKAQGVKYKNLFNGNLVDIGGIIPITTK